MHKNVRQQVDFVRSHPGFKAHPAAVLIRLALWRLLSFLRIPVSVRLRSCGLRFVLPPLWHGTSKLMYVFRDDYEPELSLLHEFLSPGKTMVDVGAHYGVYSMVASRLVNHFGTVLAFEPAEATYSVLQRNLSENHIENVTALRMAVSEKSAKMPLYHDVDPMAYSLAPANATGQPQEFEEVEVRALDDVLAEKGIKSVDFLKIDAEGADELVCLGALKTLRRDKPPVFFECHRQTASQMGLSGDGTFKVLSNEGYIFYRPREGRLVRITAEQCEGGNILALHRDSAHALGAGKVSDLLVAEK